MRILEIDKLDLRTSRKRKRLTQLVLMGKSGVHNTRISLIENGIVRPTKAERESLELALGCSIDWRGTLERGEGR